MECIIDLQVLQKALKLVGAVAKASSEDTDGQVFIEARDTGEVILLCSAKSMSITHVIKQCDVKVTGVIAVLYGKINSFLSAFNYMSDGVGVKDVKLK